MNNGDSFHNGSDNLELQRRNRYGSPAEADKDPKPADDADTDTVPDTNTDTANETAAPRSTSRGALSISSDPPAEGAGSPYVDPYTNPNAPPAPRPYRNIYAKGPAPAPEYSLPVDETPAESPDAHRGYVNIYAQRVSDRTEASEPGQYGNTPPDPATAAGLVGYDVSTGTYAPPPPIDPAAEKASHTSLILGIVSVAITFLCCAFFSVVTAILAIVYARKGRVDGKLLSNGTAGMVMGIICLGIIGLSVLMFFLMFFMILLTEGYAMM